MIGRTIIGIDVGGTFTDTVVLEPSTGEIKILKIITNIEKPEKCVIDVLDRLSVRQSISIIHAGTLASNTLLGQLKLKLPKVCIITNKGFRDILSIARQNRIEVYSLKPRKPKLPVNIDVIEINERTLADGNIERFPSREELDEIIEKIKRLNPDIVIICLLNSYVNPMSELKIRDYIKSKIDIDVVCSHEIVPICKEYERFSTTAVCAILRPIVSRYISSLITELQKRFENFQLYLVASWGGLVDVEECVKRPVILLESGPASGVIACSKLCREVNISNAIAFDMGGTTAKFSPLVDCKPEIIDEYEIAPKIHGGRVQRRTGIPVIVDMVDVVEVSAGGGTIVWTDETGMIRVGPLSAGADPGPACYGRGGDKPTITDAHVILNRIYYKSRLGDLQIKRELAYEAYKKLSNDIGMSVEEIAYSALRKINFEMSRGMKIATIERGLDPREFTLIAYGGAGPLHACELAEELEIKKLLIPQNPGVFTALGLVCMDIIFRENIPIYKLLNDIDLENLKNLAIEKSKKLIERIHRISKNCNIFTEYLMYLRYRDQDIEIPVNLTHDDTIKSVIGKYELKYSKLFSYKLEDFEIEVTRLQVVCRGSLNLKVFRKFEKETKETRIPEIAKIDVVDVFTRGTWYKCPVLMRKYLRIGNVIYGPAIIVDDTSTIFVNDGWKATVDCYRNILIEKI